MSLIINSYLERIPQDFELLLKGIGNKIRFKIALFIIKKGESSFKTIANKFHKKNSLVSHHIKILEMSGILQNILKHDNKLREYSYYKITRIGKEIILNLISSYNDFYNKINFRIEKRISETIPEDFELFLKSLNNRFRLALTLMIKDQGPLTFSQIVKMTNKEKSLISNHLKKLELSGLIQNYLKKNSMSSEYSYYKLSQYGNHSIDSLLSSYNQYYHRIDEEFNISKMEEDKVYFTAGCSSWALPNENMIGWVEILSDEVINIEISLNDGLFARDFYYIDADYNEKLTTYNLDIFKNKIKYIPFEFYSAIPGGYNAVNVEHIEISAFDLELNILQKSEIKVDIIKPIVRLNVNHEKLSENSGIFNIIFTVLRGFDVEIKKFEIEVKDKNNTPIRVIKGEKDIIDFGSELPPEVGVENLTGSIKINKKGNLFFTFKILYEDVMENQYVSNVERIEIINKEEFEGNLNYNYNYTEIPAIA